MGDAPLRGRPRGDGAGDPMKDVDGRRRADAAPSCRRLGPCRSSGGPAVARVKNRHRPRHPVQRREFATDWRRVSIRLTFRHSNTSRLDFFAKKSAGHATRGASRPDLRALTAPRLVALEFRGRGGRCEPFSLRSRASTAPRGGPRDFFRAEHATAGARAPIGRASTTRTARRTGRRPAPRREKRQPCPHRTRWTSRPTFALRS